MTDRVLQYLSHPKNRAFAMLYVALILLSVHWSLVIYINSSYLGQFVSSATVSHLYIIGSLFSLLVFFFTSVLLRKVGVYKLTIIFTALEIAALCGMALATSAFFAITCFLAHFVLVPLILFNLDIFIEEYIGTKEKQTGSMRGLYLSLLSLAAAGAPLLTGNLLSASGDSFSSVYVVGALFLIPFLIIVTIYFKKFKDPVYSLLSLKSMMRIFFDNASARHIISISFFLQLFFTWTVIYMPLYLANVAGFSWAEIGIIMFAGLSAYVIFEYPIGIIADKYIGEKEMMACGFLLIAISTSWFAFLPGAAIGTWMCAMFLTRVGASFVEATSESYFFKHTEGIDTHKISLFRMTRPLSSVIGAAMGSIALLYVQFNMLFILIAFLMIPGLFFTMLLKDTK